MKSWKTTVCGVLALVGGGLTQFYPEYAKLGGFLMFIGSGLGLLFARDNNVTSEQAGVDPVSKAVRQFGDGPPPPSLPLILLLGALAFGLSGCAWFHPQDIKPAAVAQGQDAALVNAERIHASSLGVYKEIITWETQNRAVLPVEVSRAVDKTRREFPKAWREANAILKDYRANRGDPTNVNRIAAALAAAQSSMLRLKVDASTSNELFTALNQLSESIATLKAP
jgi:hypothetical protein